MITNQTQTVIEQVRDLSNKGHTAHLNGDTEESRAHYTEAFTMATQTLEQTTVQPDRAYLFRMAASMALCVGNAQEALRLASTGLDEAQASAIVPLQVEFDLEDVHNAAWTALQEDSEDSEDGPSAPTIVPEISPDSQALEDAREVLRGATAPAILPSDLVEIGIITDRKGIRVTIDKGGHRLFTSRYVQPDQLIGAFEDASQFIIDWMPYDDGGSALKSVRDWIKRLSVVSDLRRILGVTV